MAEGGLDVRRYDADLVLELKRELGIPEGSEIADWLDREGVEPEALLFAFFSVIRPYAVMMADLLRMFEQAGATHNDHTLDVAFRFGDDGPDLGFSLEHFRAIIETWLRVTALVEHSMWTQGQLWRLNRSLGSGDAFGDLDAREWWRQYREERVWPNFRLAPPRSGDERLDRLLTRAWRVWEAVGDATTGISRDRDVLRSSLRTADRAAAEDGGWDRGLLVILDTDNWASSFVASAYSLVERISAPSGVDVAQVSEVADTLEELLAEPAVVTGTETRLERQLEEFLRLPLWKRRHELYSAWVSTEILKAVEAGEPRIHHANGKLVFAFSGTHLATLERTDARLHVWAELRSALSTPVGKGRVGAIQPDYTLTQYPITEPESAVVVVECKQYWRASAKNFSDALSDYASGRPAATIVLVNYGPAPDTILNRVPPQVRDRTCLIGEFRPGNRDAIERFRALVRDRVAPFIIPPSEGSPRLGGGEIELTWDQSPADLDLHVRIRRRDGEEEICFRTMGGADSPLGAWLDADKRNGYGPERVSIIHWLDAEYLCYVHRYSSDARLAGSGAQIRARIGEQEITLTCPATGEGDWWHVMEIDGATGHVQVIGQITNEP